MIIKTPLCAVLVAASLAAQTSPQDAQKKNDQCKVAGRLTNAATGEPIRKAKVSLHPDDPSKTVYTIESDAQGKFQLENIDPGRYTLQGEKQGFVAGWYGSARTDGSGATIDLQPGKDTSELLLKLTPQGVIAGRVLDDESEPVSGVMVTALHYMYVNGHKQLVPAVGAMQIQTNDLGEYRLAGLPPGRYYVQSSAQKIMNLQMGDEKAQGTAPEEGFVPVYFPNSTDAAAASPVDVGAGAEVRGIDLRLKKTRVQRVSGKVLDGATGEPLKSGMLMLYKRTTGVMSVLPSAMYMVQGGKGEFELRGVAPGEYNVMAMATSDPQNMKISMSRLDVGDQSVKGLTLNVGAGADVPVRASLAPGTIAPPAGKDSAGWDPSAIRIMLQADENPMASLSNAQIGKDGSGVLKHVSPDKYKLLVMGIPPTFYLQSARMGSTEVLDTGLDLRNGSSGTLELTIASPAAQLSGTVKNAKDELVPGATVTAIAKNPRARTDMAHTATTDQNGHFQIGGVVPGEYRLYAWEDIESGAGEDEDFRKPFEKFRADVDASGGTTAEPINLKLITKAMVVDAQTRR